jgi:hypothetical protein
MLIWDLETRCGGERQSGAVQHQWEREEMQKEDKKKILRKRQREEQEKEEKATVLTYFRWVFLEIFSLPARKFGNCGAKYLLCEIVILV